MANRPRSAATAVVALWLWSGACNPSPCQSGCSGSDSCAVDSIDGFVCQDLLMSGCHTQKSADDSACVYLLGQGCVGSDAAALGAIDDCLLAACRAKASVAECQSDGGLSAACSAAFETQLAWAVDAGF